MRTSIVVSSVAALTGATLLMALRSNDPPKVSQVALEEQEESRVLGSRDQLLDGEEPPSQPVREAPPPRVVEPSSQPSARAPRPTQATAQRAAPSAAPPDEQEAFQGPPDASAMVSFETLEKLWRLEQPSAEQSKNSLALADSFLTEVGLPPETVENIDCRDTLCKVDIKPDLSVSQLLAVKDELERSGIPVSASLGLGANGELQVKSAFLPREGHEQLFAAPAPPGSSMAARPPLQPGEAQP